jgi:hypothetical protein
MVLFGLVLLLPGLCTALLGAGGLTHDTDPGLYLLIVFGLAAAFGGVMLIRAAIRSSNS